MKKERFNRRKLYEVLTPEEKVLYEKVLNDIAKNEEFYATSTAEEITAHLVDECGFDKEAIYKLFKKITRIYGE
ncbi:MAG: hypothetical protein GX080_04880 [Tissierellia bacterium]|nr:hypothetical protein [Tissierellia bacterium]